MVTQDRDLDPGRRLAGLGRASCQCTSTESTQSTGTARGTTGTTTTPSPPAAIASAAIAGNGHRCRASALSANYAMPMPLPVLVAQVFAAAVLLTHGGCHGSPIMPEGCISYNGGFDYECTDWSNYYLNITTNASGTITLLKPPMDSRIWVYCCKVVVAPPEASGPRGGALVGYFSALSYFGQPQLRAVSLKDGPSASSPTIANSTLHSISYFPSTTTPVVSSSGALRFMLGQSGGYVSPSEAPSFTFNWYVTPPCPPGTSKSTSLSQLCVPCPAGKFQSPLSFVCEPCPAGRYGDRGVVGLSNSACSGECTEVPGVTVCAAAATSSNGTLCSCPAGSYPSFGTSCLCSLCPAGTFGEAGAAVSANCTGPCFAPAGSACVPGSTVAVGHPCPPGRFSLLPGCTSCTACPAGRFQATIGDSTGSCPGVCSAPAGRYCIEGSPAAAFGLPCPRGSYSFGGSVTSCTPCKLCSDCHSIA
jgi:hypothetical protein